MFYEKHVLLDIFEQQTENWHFHEKSSHKVPYLPLTHWGRVTHICVSDLTSIGSDKGLSPGRRQAIIRTNAGILLIRPLGTNFSEFFVEILIFSFKKMHLKMSSAKRRPFCLGLNELKGSCLARYGFAGKRFNGFDGIEPLITKGLIKREATRTPTWVETFCHADKYINLILKLPSELGHG